MTTLDPEPGGSPGVGAASQVRLEPERDGASELLHAGVALVGWFGFAWLWWDVLVETSATDVLRAVALVALILVVVVPVNLGWVAHNVAIFRRKGPRTGLPVVALDYEQDWTGRSVVADGDAIRRARLVEVDVVDDVKTVRPVDVHDASEPSPEQVAAA